MARRRVLAAVNLAIMFTVLFLACHPASTLESADPDVAKVRDLPPGWTKVEPAGDTRCAHDTPYAYWIRPGTTN